MSKRVKGFSEIDSATITKASTVTLFTKNIPTNLHLFINKFANYVADVSAWGYLTWKVCRNGIPIPPLDNVKDEYGDIATPYELAEESEFSPGDEISCTVTNTSNTDDYAAGVCVKGEYRS
jgi:hypothetical protein